MRLKVPWLLFAFRGLYSPRPSTLGMPVSRAVVFPSSDWSSTNGSLVTKLPVRPMAPTTTVSAKSVIAIFRKNAMSGADCASCDIVLPFADNALNDTKVPACHFHISEEGLAQIKTEFEGTEEEGCMTISGGRLCGAVRYTTLAEPIITRLCWCRVCQFLACNRQCCR